VLELELHNKKIRKKIGGAKKHKESGPFVHTSSNELSLKLDNHLNMLNQNENLLTTQGNEDLLQGGQK